MLLPRSRAIEKTRRTESTAAVNGKAVAMTKEIQTLTRSHMIQLHIRLHHPQQVRSRLRRIIILTRTPFLLHQEFRRTLQLRHILRHNSLLLPLKRFLHQHTDTHLHLQRPLAINHTPRNHAELMRMCKRGFGAARPAPWW